MIKFVHKVSYTPLIILILPVLYNNLQEPTEVNPAENSIRLFPIFRNLRGNAHRDYFIVVRSTLYKGLPTVRLVRLVGF